VCIRSLGQLHHPPCESAATVADATLLGNGIVDADAAAAGLAWCVLSCLAVARSWSICRGRSEGSDGTGGSTTKGCQAFQETT
jgi:hypothetical protein